MWHSSTELIVTKQKLGQGIWKQLGDYRQPGLFAEGQETFTLTYLVEKMTVSKQRHAHIAYLRAMLTPQNWSSH